MCVSKRDAKESQCILNALESHFTVIWFTEIINRDECFLDRDYKGWVDFGKWIMCIGPTVYKGSLTSCAGYYTSTLYFIINCTAWLQKCLLALFVHLRFLTSGQKLSGWAFIHMKYNLYIVHTLTQIHLNDAEDRINKTIFSRFLHNFHQAAWVLIPVHTEDNEIHGYHSPFYPISKSYVLKKNNRKLLIVSQRQSCLSIVLSKHAQLTMSGKSTPVQSVLCFGHLSMSSCMHWLATPEDLLVSLTLRAT